MNYNEPTYFRAERRAFGKIPVRKLRFIAILLFVAVSAIGLLNAPASRTTSLASIPTPHSERIGSDGDATGEAGGAVPAHTTVFDDGVPGVAKLNPHLLAALREAAASASDSGVSLYVDSGWRSPAYQQHLLDQAISKYGSEEEARRWVAPPERSAHVSGAAVDVGPSQASGWLSLHGAAFGLCQIYANEAWHFELRRDAANSGCPDKYADAAHDPRMQR